MCNCESCLRHRRYQQVIESGSFQALQGFAHELMGLLCDTEQELHFKECILDGSWPSAKEQLLAGLAKCAVKERHCASDEEFENRLERAAEESTAKIRPTEVGDVLKTGIDMLLNAARRKKNA